MVVCLKCVRMRREIEKAEIVKCICKLKNNKTGSSDGLVGELLKYDGSGMVYLLSIYLELCGMKRLYLRNGERGSLLTLNEVVQGRLREDKPTYL